MSEFKIEDVAPSAFTTTQAFLLAVLQAAYPKLALKTGTPFREIVANPGALITAGAQLSIINAQSAMLLSDIAASTTLDTDLADKLLSNYNVIRNKGSIATGKVKVFTSRSRDYFIPSGTVFTNQEGLKFLTTANVNVAAASDSLAVTDTPLYTDAQDPTLFFFSVAVTAEDSGSAYRLQAGTPLFMPKAFLEFLTSEALSNFAGGENEETVADAIKRIPEAIANQAPCNSVSIASFVRATYPSIPAIDVIGAGDVEMLRDKVNIFGVANFGKVDVYVRPTAAPTVRTEVFNALKGQNTGEWKFAVLAANIPGMTKIRSILPSNNATEIALTFAMVRTVASSVGRHVIPDAKSGGFSSYVNAYITISGFDVTASRGSSNGTPVTGEDNISDITMKALVGDYTGDALTNVTEQDVSIVVSSPGAPGTALVNIVRNSDGTVIAYNVATEGTYAGGDARLVANDVFAGLTIGFSSVGLESFSVGDTWTVTYKAAYFTVSVELYADDTILGVQGLLDDNSKRNPAGDYLVKNFNPCFVTMTVVLKISSLASVSEDDVKTKIFDLVNNLSIGLNLPSSQINSVCHEFPILEVVSIAMVGKLQKPDGSVLSLSGSTLEIPSDASDEVTPKTSAFYIDLADIAVDIQTVIV